MSMAIGLVLVVSAGPAVGQVSQGRLIDAVKRQDATAIEALLRDGAEVNEAQGDGATVLHWAVYLDDAPTVRALLASGARVGVTNDLGVTPLWLACNNGSATLVSVLLDAGASRAYKIFLRPV